MQPYSLHTQWEGDEMLKFNINLFKCMHHTMCEAHNDRENIECADIERGCKNNFGIFNE